MPERCFFAQKKAMLHNKSQKKSFQYMQSDELCKEWRVLLDFFLIIVYNNVIRMIEPKDQRK